MIKKVAMASPKVPPSLRPRFHPKYIPDITYPTPNPQIIAGLRVRFNSFITRIYRHELLELHEFMDTNYTHFRELLSLSLYLLLVRNIYVPTGETVNGKP